MLFLIESAQAAEGSSGAGAGDGLFGLMLPLLLLVFFFFVFIMPQQKRAKQHKKMVGALQKGDEVLTNGGIGGVIVKVTDAFITIQIAEGVEIQVQRNAVAHLIPKGTLKKS